jgi:hypothetical protein
MLGFRNRTSGASFDIGFNAASHGALYANQVPIRFITNGVECMRLNTNATITVGTTVTSMPAGYKMYVAGGILTEKVKCALVTSANWSDYVFDQKYRLNSLSNVETYVKKNKHLPGVPSGDELVKDGGIDMNQMFAKQMEKIEELTLYIIAQNKQIKMLKRRIDKLEKN